MAAVLAALESRMSAHDTPASSFAFSGEGESRSIPKCPNDLNSQKSRADSLELPAKVEVFKEWSSTTLKCTKQVIEEKLGITTPTRDPEIEKKIAIVKQIKDQYEEILVTVREFSKHAKCLSLLGGSLSQQLTAAGQRQPELDAEFAFNAAAQNVVAANFTSLSSGLDAFCDGLETFCCRTVPDIITTIHQLEQARLVYDAYRSEMERFNLPRVSPSDADKGDAVTSRRCSSSEIPAGNTNDETEPGSLFTRKPQMTSAKKLDAQSAAQLRARFENSREKYIKMKQSVDVKIRMLHENRVRVVQKSLHMMHSSTVAFFSGALQDLEKQVAKLPHLNTRVVTDAAPTSFLEETSPSPNGSSNHLVLEAPHYFAIDGSSRPEGDVFHE